MHHVANYDKASFQVPPAYEKNSQEYSRVALVDHTITGAVHTGLGFCKLDSKGILNPHTHFYEEAFFILEGQVLERIDGHDYQLGPGDYGIIQSGVPGQAPLAAVRASLTSALARNTTPSSSRGKPPLIRVPLPIFGTRRRAISVILMTRRCHRLASCNWKDTVSQPIGRISQKNWMPRIPDIIAQL